MCMLTDVFQRQRSDADQNAHNRRSNSGAGADPSGGSRYERGIQHSGDDGSAEQMSSCTDCTLSLAVQGLHCKSFIYYSPFFLSLSLSLWLYMSRVSTAPGNPRNLLEFKNPPGNPGNLLKFNWSSWKFLCKTSKIDRISFQS